jgi:hypothetical protein
MIIIKSNYFLWQNFKQLRSYDSNKIRFYYILYTNPANTFKRVYYLYIILTT